MNLSVWHAAALLGSYTFLSIIVAPLDQLYFFLFFNHLKLDVKEICELNTN